MWHEGVIDGYWWQAKVFNEGSQFGINNGRVSKLSICEGEVWNHKKQVYGYDRGLDFDNCPAEVFSKIMAHCESLPAYDVAAA